MRHEPTMYGLAQYDLDTVRVLILEDPENVPSICLHAQQASEKILKDKLLQLGRKEWGHDLVKLMEEITKRTGIEPNLGLIADATSLTDLYFTIRYGDKDADEPLVLSEELSQDAWDACVNIIGWVESIKRLPDGSFIVSENRRPRKRSIFARFRR